MKRKLKIAFDLDSTLVDFITPLKGILKHQYGIDLKDDFKTFDLRIPTGLSNKELWTIFRNIYEDYNHIPILPGATELLTKLFELTNEAPLILTARPPDTIAPTYSLVKKIVGNIPFSLILKQHNGYKCQYLGRYEYYVEDRRKTALSLEKRGFIVPLVKTNYNEIENIKKYKGRIFYIKGVHELIPVVNYFVQKNTFYG